MTVWRLSTVTVKGRVYWRAHRTNHLGRREFRGGGPKSGMTKRQAEAWCQSLEADDSELRPDRDKAVTIERWTDRYIAKLRARVGEGTRQRDRETIAYLIDHFGADARLRALTPDDGDEWVASLWEAELAEATICRHIRTAKSILKAAVERGHMKVNPWRHLSGTAPKPEKDWRKLTEAEISKLIEACPDDRWRAMVALCAIAGLRKGEALRLAWEDVKWGENRLVVRAIGGRRTTKIRRREVRMEPELEAMLSAIHAERPDNDELVVGMLDRNLHRKMCGYTEREPRGGDKSPRRYIGIIERAGMEPWSGPFHTLRKWRETTWMAKFPAPFVAQWLGNSVQVAMDHYTAVPDEYYSAEGPDRANFVQTEATSESTES